MLDRPLARRRLADLLDALDRGETTAVALAEAALAAAADPAKPGATVFAALDPVKVRALAAAQDGLRAAGGAGPLGGLPVSIKDLFDVRGEVTTAGSVVLADRAPAAADAPAIARLRAAGIVPVGRTTMTEFAFSGLGLNPHTGTPGNAHDRTRIPGGSTAGGAVSVADGMAAAAIGSDTGGSVRIPAALNGLVGFKPTRARVPTEGAVPLSATLDTVGPIAPGVGCCWALLQVMAGQDPAPLRPRPVDRLALGIVRDVVYDDAEPAVERAIEAAVAALSRAGARLVEIAAPELAEALAANGPVPFAAAEAFAWHEDLIAEAGARYDPRVLSRIELGRDARAADYIRMVAARRRLVGAWARRIAGLDGVLLPTVPIAPPRIADLDADDAAYHRANRLMLRNTTLANLLDAPAVSLPAPVPEGALPVGLSVMAARGGDAALAAAAAGIEAVLAAP